MPGMVPNTSHAFMLLVPTEVLFGRDYPLDFTTGDSSGSHNWRAAAGMRKWAVFPHPEFSAPNTIMFLP